MPRIDGMFIRKLRSSLLTLSLLTAGACGDTAERVEMSDRLVAQWEPRLQTAEIEQKRPARQRRSDRAFVSLYGHGPEGDIWSRQELLNGEDPMQWIGVLYGESGTVVLSQSYSQDGWFGRTMYYDPEGALYFAKTDYSHVSGKTRTRVYFGPDGSRLRTNHERFDEEKQDWIPQSAEQVQSPIFGPERPYLTHLGMLSFFVGLPTA